MVLTQFLENNDFYESPLAAARRPGGHQEPFQHLAAKGRQCLREAPWIRANVLCIWVVPTRDAGKRYPPPAPPYVATILQSMRSYALTTGIDSVEMNRKVRFLSTHIRATLQPGRTYALCRGNQQTHVFDTHSKAVDLAMQVCSSWYQRIKDCSSHAIFNHILLTPY